MTKQPPPIPPKSKKTTSPPHVSRQQHLGNRDDPINPFVLASALLAIALILLSVAWFLTSRARSLPDATAKISQDAPADSEKIKLGTGAENDSNELTDLDSEEGHEEDPSQTDSQPAANQNESSNEEDTAKDSLSKEDAQTARTRVLNTGASKRLSADGTNPFLIGTETSSTVFVIDKSSSMSGAAFSSVRNSLLQAIEILNASQRFSVIFFDSVAHPMLPNHMVNADDKGKDLATNFMERMSPTGGTNPYSATRMALDMHPDSVIVLSDGDFDITEVKRITQENQMDKKIPIHCIGLQSHIRTLQKLAEDNSGTYRTATTPP